MSFPTSRYVKCVLFEDIEKLIMKLYGKDAQNFVKVTDREYTLVDQLHKKAIELAIKDTDHNNKILKERKC